MTKRRLMHSAVAQTTQEGVPRVISGIAASWALPANTTKVISNASGIDRPPFTMATPVTRPQAAMPRLTALISRAPARNCGWRSVCLRESMGVIVPGDRVERPSGARSPSGIVRLRRRFGGFDVRLLVDDGLDGRGLDGA